jgi:hypothetical protein
MPALLEAGVSKLFWLASPIPTLFGDGDTPLLINNFELHKAVEIFEIQLNYGKRRDFIRHERISVWFIGDFFGQNLATRVHIIDFKIVGL